ncbi:hypothetical protein T440DRAFT_297360 [Plenodomus tracheiphilus IPT5]|uniref:N-acetyltransferase domain-containing protein n=1 Tax=Plenodomus tracheiphilus IPT5 TaxID=1408161 RepID=A0A6A7APC0_9PLEO|nr:hypothetical protein T440DRAFT_297360 [Plenodomus tracheiphilus IPT5]
MLQAKADFIKIPTGSDGFQTHPTKPSKRLPDVDITLKPCDASDAEKIAEGLYAAFPPTWWDKKEPPALRPANDIIRVQRMAKRLLPSLSYPHMKWMKAVLTSTNETIGVAGWMAPSNPGIHNIFRRSAIDYYSWRQSMGWTDQEVDEMWSHTDDEAWSVTFGTDDETREEVLGGERHWYLAPLLTWPGWQGKGVGKRLLTWAIEQADGTDPVTPLYLESAPTARAVYMHCGFVPQGEYNFVRRGPAVVKGLEGDGKAEDDQVGC